MNIISDSYRKKQIEELDKLINKAFWYKHKNIWHLIKWRNQHKNHLEKEPLNA